MRVGKIVFVPPPPVRRDGRCFVCGGERKLPASKLHRRAATVDPFCSRDCAARWHSSEHITQSGDARADQEHEHAADGEDANH